MRAVDSIPGVRRALQGVAGGAVTATCLALLCTAGVAQAAAPDGAVTTGLGSYYTKPKGSAPAPPVATYRTGEALGKAPPTSQWYSSVMFSRWGHPLHAHPMTYRASEQGFELGLPDRQAVAPDAFQREVRYPHVAAIVVAPVDFKPRDTRLARFSDWLVQLSMAASDGKALTATVLHGSPFSYFECSSGDVRFRFAARPEPIADPGSASDPRVVAVTIAGHSYALFGPTGATWERSGSTDAVLHLPPGARYFSVAGLPDSNPATVRDFLAVAYAFPTSTRADWSYDEKASAVRTTFRVETVAREGQNLTTFMGLYPHHWSALAPKPASQYRYDSVRGPIRLIAGNSFAIDRVYHGTVPLWAGLEDPAHRAAVDSLLGGDVAKSDELFMHQQGKGTYWQGKAFGASAQVLSVAEAEGRTSARNELLGTLKRRLEAWFDGRHATYFLQDDRIGTFIGLPEEFKSYTDMNDHHFHYGYWIMAAAHVALRDPDWASSGKWGGIVEKIVADIATDERGRADFPFLRNFDSYEGHSWASGDSTGAPVVFDNGNNQESSSEAVNAWAGLILWGEATGNRRLRDLGIYLYTSEVASVQQYWFDLDHQVLGADFGKPFAVQVFGGKYAYNTWWTEEPHQMYGINALPFTPASTYLGADPAYVRAVFAVLPAEEKHYREHGNIPSNPPPSDIWQDAIASWFALADPDAALGRWNKQGSVESGETRSHTLHWILSLKEMGTPDFSVTADTPLYAVFKNASGVRTYLAYNARDAAMHVTFSTGKVVDVAPRSLTRSH
jgi:endoglucanase Acf2